MPNLKVTQQETSDTGLVITLEGVVNPDLATKLMFGGCDYTCKDGEVKIVLKLPSSAHKEKSNAGKQSTSTSSPRHAGGEGKDIHALQSSSGDSKQDAREENEQPAKKEKKVQAVRKKK